MSERDERVDHALAEYLAACDAGDPPDREAFLAKYPDLAESLAEFIADHERMRQAADPAATCGLAPASTSLGTIRYVGDYELVEEIARGGMGVVYRARQLSVNRIVAVKMILAGAFAGEADVRRFRVEAEAAANLDHPNILPVYEVSEHEGRPYFSMKLAEGGSLAGRIGKLDTPAAAALLAKLARAVHFAHQRGILHRDLKPANVLLDTHGEPLIADFGLARRGDAANATQTGAVLGTPSYMPPEQARAERGLSTAADVYALGAILYECLTGQPPFREASTAETLLAVLEREPSHPRSLNRAADADLSVIALKCLRKEPRERYASATDLADDLERWLRGEPITARPVGRRERVVKWVRRNPAVSALAAAVLLSLTLGMAVSAWFAYEAGQEARAARRAEAEAKDREQAEAAAKAEARKQLRRASWLVYAGKLSLAQSAFADGDVSVALQHLNECQWDLRGWEHDHLWTRFNANMMTLEGLVVTSVAYSPDGKRILASASEGVKVWDAQTGQRLLTLKGHTEPTTSVTWSPDGRRILTGSKDGTAKLWDAQTGRELHTFRGHAKGEPFGWVMSVAFSPNGTRILTGGWDQTTRLWDAEKGTQILTRRAHVGSVNSVAWSPDGKHILTGGSDRTARLWDTEKGTLLLTLEGHTDSVTSVAFSPDGRGVITGSWDGTARVWDPRTGRKLHTLSGHTWRRGTGDRWVNSVAWSPDGKHILTGGADDTAKVWQAQTGRELFTLKGHFWGVSSVAFSPDGRRALTGSVRGARVWDIENLQNVLPLGENISRIGVAWNPEGSRLLAGGTGIAGQRATVLDLKTGKELRAFEANFNRVSAIAWSRDGKYVVTGSQDMTARVWDAHNGQELRVLKGHTADPRLPVGWVTSVTFSHDSRHILTGGMDMTARLWDAEKGTEILTLKGHTGWVTSVAFCPDARRVLTGSHDKSARVWDARTGGELFTLKGHADVVTSVCFSPDGKRILTGSDDKTARIWDAQTGWFALSLKAHVGVQNVAFSPAGLRVVTGSDQGPGGSAQGEARIWDARKRQQVHTLYVLTEVTGVAFSPDSKRLFAWDKEEKVLAWSTITGQPVDPTDPPPMPPPGPAVSPDGSLRALPRGNAVEVTDRRRFDPKANHWPLPDRDDRLRYHTEQAAAAEQQKQHFTAAFHLERLLLLDPDNKELNRRHKEALEKFQATLPAPKVDPAEATEK